MPNRLKGLVFIILGVLQIIGSILSDFIRGKSFEIGPIQIALTILGIELIILGVFKLSNKETPPDSPLRKKGELSISHLLVNIILVIILFLLLIFPIQFIYKFLTLPFPIEYREVASIYSSIGFSEGINPYSLQNYPEYIYVYGPLYDLLLLPFIKTAVYPLLIARWINVFFLLHIIIITYWYLRKKNTSLLSSFIGVMVILNSICYIWSMNGARPDAIALFFGLAAFYPFFRQKMRSSDIFFSALFCLFAFYSKQYMVFSAIAITIYLFLFISKQKSVIFLLFFGVLGAASFAIINQSFPMFVNYSVIHHLTMAGNDIKRMVEQSRDFFNMFWPLCLFFVIIIHKLISEFIKNSQQRVRLLSLNFRTPLINLQQPDVTIFTTLLAIILLTFALGRNDNNNYSYYGELLLPFLILSTVPKIDSFFKSYPHKVLIELIIIIFCILPLRKLYSINYTYSKNAFEILYANAEKCNNIYDQTPLASIYKVEHDLHPIYNSGQTNYALTVLPNNAFLVGKFSKYTDKEILELNNDWEEKINISIKNQSFDCIFSEDTEPMLNYELQLKIPNVLGRTVYLYKPLNK